MQRNDGFQLVDQQVDHIQFPMLKYVQTASGQPNCLTPPSEPCDPVPPMLAVRAPPMCRFPIHPYVVGPSGRALLR